MIYHIALAADWAAAVARGGYEVSTVGRSLQEEGFIHTSYPAQLRGVADRFYAGVTEPLVLLCIDERLLVAPVRVDPVAGSDTGFPHVYGPVDVDAVVEVTPLRRDRAGRLELPAL